MHFGTGGEDSKNFVNELFSAYLKYANKKFFKCELLNTEYGHIICKIKGQNVFKVFKNEIGQHSCQRVPNNERNGRRHTSIISVTVLPIKEDVCKSLELHEVEITPQMCRLHSGGQNAQKNATAIRAIHIETGISVFIQNERSQKQNKDEALKILSARVNDFKQSKVDKQYAEFRRTSLGDGRRGSKIRTYNFTDCRVTDHNFGVKTSKIDEVMNGNFDLLVP